MWSTRAALWCSRILFESTPTYLLRGLVFFYEKVRRWQKSHPTSLALSGAALKTYDLLNSGPRNRFVVGSVIAHNCSYGAGPAKIHETLIEGGVDISLSDVKQIHTAYWRLFSGVKRFEAELVRIHARTGGWIPNVLGRPICVDKGYLKDIVNRMIQSSGHDCLQLFIAHLARLREERSLAWWPWILDMHDETIVEVHEDAAEATVQAFRDALAAVNAELGMGIPLQGEPMIARTWADIKIEG